MIVTKIIGGLGNQLFQYAVARHLAYIYNTVVRIDTSLFNNYRVHQYSLHHFNLKGEIIWQGEDTRGFIRRLFMRLLSGGSSVSRVVEQSFAYDASILNLPDNVYLEGYWQSEKYFKSIESIIREEFTVITPPDSQNAEMAAQITGCNALSLHVRRGDYVSNPKANAHHGTCTMDYYKQAVELTAKQVSSPVFFVFSDDIEWVKTNLQVDFPTVYVDHNGPEKNYEDLRLMSLCKHNIIANSSFSWWGAWLNSNKEKLVYAPQRWFAGADHNTKDLIPEGWIRL